MLWPFHNPQPRDVQSASLEAANLVLTHLFRKGWKGMATESPVQSQYDNSTETITRCEGRLYDKNEDTRIEIRNTLLIGSNYGFFATPKQDDLSAPGSSIISYELKRKNISDIANPELSELVSWAMVNEIQRICSKNNMPSAQLYLPSDLASGRIGSLISVLDSLVKLGMVSKQAADKLLSENSGAIKDFGKIRDALRATKVPHPMMAKIMEELGVPAKPAITFQEADSDPAKKEDFLHGRSILFALESESRQSASILLESIVKRGIEATVDKYNPSGIDEWRRKKNDKGDKWAWDLRHGVYYLDFTRQSKQSLAIPIGVTVPGKESPSPGSPKCALIATALLMKMQAEYDITHLIYASHSDEVPVAEAGFFVAKKLLGVPIRVFSAKINRSRGIVETSGRECTHAFRGRLYDPDDLTSESNGHAVQGGKA